jgi:hypothetical protein
MRVCVPQGSVAGIDHGGRRYLAKNGIMNVPDHVGRHLIKHDECFPAQDVPKADGFVCSSCGFHGYFRTCGRCQGACERPNTIKEHAHGTEA